jgi:protein-ribulosamine 3-kinase
MPAVTANILTDIKARTGIGLHVDGWLRIAGGDINESYRAEDSAGRRWFIKLNKADFLDHFAAEADGLSELARAQDIRVPAVEGYGTTASQAWLLLEWLDMSQADNAAGERLGHALAALHRISAPDFGWHRDNVIGAIPQLNDPRSDWVSFYRDMRLAPQLRLASQNGASGQMLEAGQKLMDGVGQFFANYSPSPSLLHGDLWGGNWGCLTDGTPVLFDPAVYYGDREADIAMTKLFGGFPESFYTAYGDAWPLDHGHVARVELYKLYHVLNHFNLFGGGYAVQAEGMLGRLLGQI